jgi:putative MFS transporter
LSVPALREGGGNALLFVVFAAFFVLAAVATWWLPERRGESLESAVPAT